MSVFILSDFLSALHVPHTQRDADKQFAAMPFKSLFGLSKLLEKYGIDSEGYALEDRKEITSLPTPFLAHTPKGFVIVKSTSGGRVSYRTQGIDEETDMSSFNDGWDGIVFIAYPKEDAREPDYTAHRRMEIFDQLKRVALVVIAVLLFAYLFVSNGIYRHLSLIFATACNIFGLFMSYLLVQKMMRIKSHTADKVCGVLQEGGCDTVLETKASTFFGIFSWSEVGFTYFSVSLLTLLIFPQYVNYLAACNICCLPFTLWSIWYQRFRAKAWCTLCVSVQATLWLIFICYLCGGWISGIFPLRIEFFVLVLSYGFVLLALNRLTPMLVRQEQ